MQKMAFSCGGHLFLPSSSDQFMVDALTGTDLLGTEGGARFLCGPHNRKSTNQLSPKPHGPTPWLER